MKILAPIFSIFLVISLLCSVTIFIAGTSIFLAIRGFNDINSYAGLWAAYPIIIIAVILFSYAALALIGDMFFRIFKRKGNGAKSKYRGLEIALKLFISFILYKILKLFQLHTKDK